MGQGSGSRPSYWGRCGCPQAGAMTRGSRVSIAERKLAFRRRALSIEAEFRHRRSPMGWPQRSATLPGESDLAGLLISARNEAGGGKNTRVAGWRGPGRCCLVCRKRKKGPELARRSEPFVTPSSASIGVRLQVLRGPLGKPRAKASTKWESPPPPRKSKLLRITQAEGAAGGGGGWGSGPRGGGGKLLPREFSPCFGRGRDGRPSSARGAGRAGDSTRSQRNDQGVVRAIAASSLLSRLPDLRFRARLIEARTQRQSVPDVEQLPAS